MTGASRTVRTEEVVVQVVPNKKWKERDIISPERTKVWMEPKTTTTSKMMMMKMVEKKKKKKKVVPVVYYLSKDGHLEHPHFIEVPLSSNDGLHLRDVINRLNSLRGKGMASMYSWSSKRSYKSGFVWHDLSENDFIYPAHGQEEYVLKGSELFLESGSLTYSRSEETGSSSSSSSSSEKTPPPETQKKSGSGGGGESSKSNFPVVVIQRRNQSWSSSSIDHLHEYKVYKTESTGEYAAGGKAADAGTQTDEKRRRRRIIREEEDEQEKTPPPPPPPPPSSSTELSREEISPPPSSSSPEETLESLIKKADGRISSMIISSESDIRNQTVNNNQPSGRVRASTVLKQLISCGGGGGSSFTVKEECDGGSISVKDQRLSLIQSHYREDRLPHHTASSSSSSSTSNQKESFLGNPSRFTTTSSTSEEEEEEEAKEEYFSGSIESKKKEEEEEVTEIR